MALKIYDVIEITVTNEDGDTAKRIILEQGEYKGLCDVLTAYMNIFNNNEPKYGFKWKVVDMFPMWSKHSV